MTITSAVFTALLWFALIAVALGAGYLLVVLVIDWKKRRLW